MKPKFGEKMRYNFENFMSRGGSAVFISLLILFFIAFGIVAGIRALMFSIDPQPFGEQIADSDMGEHVWLAFTEIADPGNVGGESPFSIQYKILGIVTILVGMVIFSALIGLIGQKFEETVYNFRKGKSKVIESDHTIILGWNERVMDIIDTLIIANESRKKAAIVVLAEKDKEEMDDEISESISDTKTTKIITRNGVTSSVTQLAKVNVPGARSAILLSTCPEGASPEEKTLSDTKIIKTMLALISVQGGENKLNIVLELFHDESFEIIKTLGDPKINAITAKEILGKLLVQTSISGGLEVVYGEILGYSGSETYFVSDEFTGMKFDELAYHYPDGAPYGIRRQDGAVIINPPEGSVMQNGDELIMLAQDDSTIKFKKTAEFTPADFPYEQVTVKKETARQLLLGWHSIATVVIDEFADYLADGSVIDILIDAPSDDIKKSISELRARNSGLSINLIEANPLSMENLRAVSPFGYNNVIILAQNENDFNPEKVDSDTLVILLFLRKILSEKEGGKSHTKIITQVLNSENQELITDYNADDFIISNKMLTYLMSQLSEEPGLIAIYNQLFGAEGSEIYLKPANFYFSQMPVEVTFPDMIHAARKRGEICIGLRISENASDADKNYGVIINPGKKEKFALTGSDYIVVFAEDEL
ncbi:MAG: hypothetical protein A2014_09560 [Spirochaetes bacterium GWF1_49_6]|nr:MAG: hypothetical protein A2014_09560 [Spirochaetes bacterium GWF1_49_6]